MNRLSRFNTTPFSDRYTPAVEREREKERERNEH